MRISMALFTALVALSACNKKAAEPQEPSNEQGAPNSLQTANQSTPAVPHPLPPQETDLRFIGTWAAEPAMCAQAPWKFSERELETTGHVRCAFERINAVPGGYDIATTCTAEAEEQKDELRLRFNEDGPTMALNTNKVLSEIGLIYCGN